MTKDAEEKKCHQIAEFRYGIIAELTNPYLGHGELQKLITQKAVLTYDIPHSTKLAEAVPEVWKAGSDAQAAQRPGKEPGDE